MFPRLIHFLPLSCLGFATLGAALAQNPQPPASFYSLEKEIALGRKLAEDMEQKSEILDDADVSEFISRLGERLAGHADAQAPITIKVVVDSTPAAAAFPGGFLFLSSGLIREADSEAELAAVLAHQIAHVAARHGTRPAPPGKVVDFSTIPLLFLGGWGGSCNRLARQTTLPLAFFSVAGGLETEADSLGLGYLHDAGYEPHGLAEIFEKLPRDRRVEPGLTVRDTLQSFLASSVAKPEYLVNTAAFNRIKQRLARSAQSLPKPKQPSLLQPN